MKIWKGRKEESSKTIGAVTHTHTHTHTQVQFRRQRN